MVIFFIVWFAVDSYMLTRTVFHEAGITPIRLLTTKPKLTTMARRVISSVPALIIACACFGWYAELADILNSGPGSFRAKFVELIGASRLRLDLEGAELSKRRPGFERIPDENLFNVRSANLTYRRFRDADLMQAYLVGARLEGADLTRASLVGTHLRKASLEYVTARYARCAGANLYDTVLFRTNLSHANLDFANLSKASGSHTIFRNGTLKRALLQKAELPSADFRQADVSGADLSEADLTHSNLDGANFTDSSFPGTKLSGVSLRGTNLSGANLTKAEGLEADQISKACGNEKTQLPQYLIDAGVKLKPCSEMRQESSKP